MPTTLPSSVIAGEPLRPLSARMSTWMTSLLPSVVTLLTFPKLELGSVRPFLRIWVADPG
jgi:hypothetical protein